MAKKSKNNRKKSNQLLIAFWVLIFILLIVVFFARRNQIKQNLSDTDFFGRIFGKTPAFMQDSKTKDDATDASKLNLLGASSGKEKYTEITGTEANKVSQSVIEETKKSAEIANQYEASSSASGKDSVSSSGKSSDSKENSSKTSGDGEASANNTALSNGKTAADSSKNQEKTVSVPKKTEVTVYFVAIDSDGSVSRKASRRTLEKSDSPLTDSINALLSGPTIEERGKDYMTLIPPGTRLLGASVKNGTATLNFSENFQFNSVGVEGYIAQLMQIVYTATEFSTVRNVQFLIEGEKKDYLGSEGQWIGTPLARSSF